jgi:hypothetical protein
VPSKKEVNRRLNKFVTYDVSKLKSNLKEAEEVPDYHDPKYFEYMKKKQRKKKVGLKSNLHRADKLH